MDSQAYWAKRQLEREARWHDLTTTELRKLKRYYVAAAADIERDVAALYAKYADENGLSMTAARKLIRGSEFKAWRMTLQEYVAASKADPKILRELNTLAMRSRISRLEALHARTLMATIDLAERLQEAADAHFARAYLDTYYGNLYDYHKTVGLYTPPNAVDAKRVESVLQTAWLGKNYSSRIWTNRAKLGRELQATILQGIHRGSSIQQLSKALSRRMDVAYSNAERLIRTELNAVENRASAAAMKAADFTHYQFMATLDRRTCARCGEHDGEVYKLSEMNQGENAPPLHARCRCTIVAYLDVAKGERVAGRERLPENVTYRQWQAKIDNFTSNEAAIRGKLEAVKSELKIKGELIYPPPKIDLSAFKFDAAHTQGDKHPHAEQEARQFVADAYFAIYFEPNNSYNYFGKKGAAYVQTGKKKIRTAFKSVEYNPKFKQVIENAENDT